MTESDAKLSIAAIDLILTRGVPFFIRTARTMDIDHDPTVDEIIALRDLPDPAEYFEENT